MPDRKIRRPSYTIDVVLLTAVGSQLAVLLCRAPEGREKWVLPWDASRPQEIMEAAATRIAKATSAGEPAWLEQVGALGDGKRHPSESEISVAYAGLMPMGTPSAGSETTADSGRRSSDDPGQDGSVSGGVPPLATNVYAYRAPADVRAAPRKALA